MFKKFLPVVAFMLFAASTSAQDLFAISVDETYDDMTFSVESAIVDRGLNIDTISHVGTMLNRTATDVGATVTVFTDASVFNFCSAVLSRAVMEVDPTNIRYCPYGIFVYTTTDNPDQTVIGHLIYGDPDMADVNALLDAIVTEAAGL